MFEDDQANAGPRGTFESYKAEGDILFKNGEYQKALESYNTALEIEPNNKNCLVARSRCSLQLGDTEKAYADAEASLKEDRDFHKGLYQKAEALYYKGEFEMALVYYHRGRRLRPELEIFRLGIQKAQEAIANIVGSPERTKLTKHGDLTFFKQFTEAKKAPARTSKIGRKVVTKAQGKTYKVDPSRTDSKSVKQLLGELYGDRVYLEKLLGLTERKQNCACRFIYDTVCDSLCYLDARTDLWRQQKPAAHTRAQLQRSMPKVSAEVVGKYIKKEMLLIDRMQSEGKLQECITKAKNMMKTIKAYTSELVPDLQDIIGGLHCYIGNAYIDKRKYELALKHHKCDLKIATSTGNTDSKLRAHENIGRAYAKLKQYSKAIESWSVKLSACKKDAERAWLEHEMGRAYMELGKHAAACDCGQRALQAATNMADDMWRLNAQVLLAQVSGKLKEHGKALKFYREAQRLAKTLGERKTENAIARAIADTESRV